MGHVQPLVVSVDDEREVPRTNLFLSAVAHWAGTSAPVRLRDLSATGARLEGPVLPDLDKPILLSRGELRCEGLVVWREPGRCGVRFNDMLQVVAWIPGSSSEPGQAKVDQMVARVRFEQSRRDVAPTHDPLSSRIAEEIVHTTRLLQGISEALAADPLVAASHRRHLKEMSVSVRVLAHIARILAAADADVPI